MLSIFPSMLVLGIFAPLILRLAVAFFMFGLVRSLNNKLLITNYFVNNKYPGALFIATIFQIAIALTGFFLMIGLFTQVAALVAIYLILTLGNINKEVHITKHSASTFNYLALICFSLLFLGAGAFAFDLPV